MKDLTFDEKSPDSAKYHTVAFNFVIPCTVLFHSQCATSALSSKNGATATVNYNEKSTFRVERSRYVLMLV